MKLLKFLAVFALILAFVLGKPELRIFLFCSTVMVTFFYVVYIMVRACAEGYAEKFKQEQAAQIQPDFVTRAFRDAEGRLAVTVHDSANSIFFGFAFEGPGVRVFLMKDGDTSGGFLTHAGIQRAIELGILKDDDGGGNIINRLLTLPPFGPRSRTPVGSLN